MYTHKLDIHSKTIFLILQTISKQNKTKQNQNNLKIQNQILLLKYFMGIGSVNQNLNVFRNQESIGIVDGTQTSTAETCDCSSETCQSRITMDYCPQKKRLLHSNKPGNKNPENGAFIFMTLQLSLVILLSQFFYFIKDFASRQFHDPLKSEQIMGLNFLPFP